MGIRDNEVKKRASNFTEKPFPFEIVHIDVPANNMELFHWHEYMEISFVRKGRGVYEIEDKVFTVEKGDIIIINNIERHRVKYDPSDPLFETVIHFDTEFILHSREQSPGSSYTRLFLYNDTNFNNKPDLDNKTKKEIAVLVSEIESEYLIKKPYYELMIRSRLLTVITYLLRLCDVIEVTDYDLITKRNKIGRLEQVLEYINRNYNQDISMDSVAHKFFMNPSYFSDYFKKNVGVTFSEYLMKQRIMEAVRLLKEGGTNSTEVAFSCGFNNTTSFYNAFKRITSMNPGDYRKVQRNTN